jgi:hypothetical protein
MPHRYYTLRNLIVLSDLQPPRKPLVVEVRRVRHLKGDLLIIENAHSAVKDTCTALRASRTAAIMGTASPIAAISHGIIRGMSCMSPVQMIRDQNTTARAG